MSQPVSAILQIEFDAQVKAAYQGASKLRQHVTVRTGAVGATQRFRRSGRGVAQPRVPGTDLPVMNARYAEAVATLSDWSAAEYIDKLDRALVNFDERTIIAKNIGSAIGRRIDQMLIEAIDAANAAFNIPAGGSGVTDAKLRRAKAIMDDRAVEEGNRKLVISARGQEDLLGDTRLTSRDFVQGHFIQEGRLPKLYGFDIIVIDSRDEGGLPFAAAVRTCFAFDKAAIGLAIGVETPLEVNYVPEKTSYLSAQLLKAGSVAIDPLGIIEIGAVES